MSHDTHYACKILRIAQETVPEVAVCQRPSRGYKTKYSLADSCNPDHFKARRASYLLNSTPYSLVKPEIRFEILTWAIKKKKPQLPRTNQPGDHPPCEDRSCQKPRMPPQLIYGTATFGMDMTEFQDSEAVRNMLKTVQSLGIKRLDTAPRYPPLNPGRAEKLLGEALELSGDFVIDTKIATDTRTDGSGDLVRDVLQKSVGSSLERLKRPQGVRPLS